MRPANLLRHPSQIPTNKLSVGCFVLDRLLGGGIPTECITEIFGEAGIGKTQMALQLIVTSQMPVEHGGLNGCSLYLYSDIPFPYRRLVQIASRTPYSGIYNPGRVFMQAIQDVDQLLDVICRLDYGVYHSNIKLIIVDSIASIFRSAYSNSRTDLIARSAHFFKISSKLKLVARKYGVVVVVINQVTDVFEPSVNIRIGNAVCMQTSGRNVCASLGVLWASCINMRLFMSKISTYAEGNFIRNEHFIRVVLAPHLPDSSSKFDITNDGVRMTGYAELYSNVLYYCEKCMTKVIH